MFKFIYSWQHSQKYFQLWSCLNLFKLHFHLTNGPPSCCYIPSNTEYECMYILSSMLFITPVTANDFPLPCRCYLALPLFWFAPLALSVHLSSFHLNSIALKTFSLSNIFIIHGFVLFCFCFVCKAVFVAFNLYGYCLQEARISFRSLVWIEFIQFFYIPAIVWIFAFIWKNVRKEIRIKIANFKHLINRNK